jgi:hypothetical protein
MKRIALAFMSVAMLVCVGSSAFANGKSVKLNDNELDGIAAGFYNINYNVSPIVVHQNSTVSISQNGNFSGGYPYFDYFYGYPSGGSQIISAGSSNVLSINANSSQH